MSEEQQPTGDEAEAEVARDAEAEVATDAGAEVPTEAEAEVPTDEGTGTWPVDRLRPLVEALLFASGDPLPAKKIAEIVEGSTVEEVKATLVDLSTELLTRGIRVVEVAGGWQLRTAPEHQRYVRKLFREKPQRLTRAATDTVAVVAYKQPVTRHEIEAVRGVDSGGVLESLIERRLVKVVGRKDVPGRPLVYATTREFLELFGLNTIRDLPTLPELGSDFERMSERGGFYERDDAPVLPLEEGDGAQDETAGGLDTVEEGRFPGPGEAAPDDGEGGLDEAAAEKGHEAVDEVADEVLDDDAGEGLRAAGEEGDDEDVPPEERLRDGEASGDDENVPSEERLRDVGTEGDDEDLPVGARGDEGPGDDEAQS